MSLPKFISNAGNMLNLPSLSFDDERFYVQNSTEDECRDYAESLASNGYTLYDKNEIPSGNEYCRGVNLFYTFVSEGRHVFLFWDASLFTTFVISTPPSPLPNLKKPFSDSEIINKPQFSQLRLVSGGMSYVVKLSDGSFIIIDGGKPNATDIETLYTYLKSNTRNGKPKIAMWFFTHAHNDHIGLAVKFLKLYKNDVEIASFAHQFPNCDNINVACDMPEEKELMMALLDSIKENFPNSTVYYMHTGQRYYFCGAELEVLASMDNSFPSLYFSLNDTSVITRLRFDSGKTVMLLADSSHHESRMLANTYGSYLKSDFMQLAHHGLLGGDIDLYRFIDPDICLWPVRQDRFDGTLENQKYQWCKGEGGLNYNVWIRDEKIKHREHYAQNETVTFEV